MFIFDWFRGIFNRIKKNTIPSGTIERAFDVEPAISRFMEDNVNLWYAMYCNHPPWESDCVRPLGLPGAIGRELARHVMTEFSIAVSGGQRGDYLNEQIQTARKDFKNILEIGLCLGGVALRPYTDGQRILVDATSATAFTPTEFDGTGRAVAGVFRETVKQKKEYYTRLEYHGFESRENGERVYFIRNKAYKSDGSGNIGVEISLSDVERWSYLQPENFIENIEKPLFAYFKPPISNDVEPDSRAGISVYSSATVDLIEQADRQWELLRWEYRSGERKIFTESTSVRADQFLDRLFEVTEFTNDGDLFEIFSPEFRDDPLYKGFQSILQRIEFNTGLAYGTLSDPKSVEKTATEILSAKQRQYATGENIQQAFQDTLDDLLYAIDVYCDLHRLAPSGEYEVVYNWGDGVLDDPDTKRQDMAMDISLVNAGILNDWEFRMKWYKEDEETAKSMLPKMESLVNNIA